MNNKQIAYTGFLGVMLFAVASLLGGFQFDDYNPMKQFISETMAVGTPYGNMLRYFGYIPSGILLTVFSVSIIKTFPSNKSIKIGFLGVALFYGVATVLVGIFPCDVGCNKEWINPSLSQLIHNLTGFLTYIFVPFSILLIGIGLQKHEKFASLGRMAFLTGGSSFVFVMILLSSPLSDYAGLFQRIIETLFIIWVVSCSKTLFTKTVS